MKITMDLTMSEVKEMINNGGEAVPVDDEIKNLNDYLEISTKEIARLNGDLKTATKEITKLRSIIEGLESVTPKVEIYEPHTFGDPVGVIDGLPVYGRNGKYACWYGPNYDDNYRAEDMKLLATLVKEIKR